MGKTVAQDERTVYRPYAHALIVGGTGMLFEASVALAARSRRLTSVARTPRSLATLDAAVRDLDRVHHVLALDWHAPERFLGDVEQHVKETEPPDLVVAWIHDDALAIRLAKRLAAPARPPTFVHVVGSASGNVLAAADGARRTIEASRAAVSYRQVILGAHGTDDGVRWLTHQEISAGVLAAIERGPERFVVGSLSPA